MEIIRRELWFLPHWVKSETYILFFKTILPFAAIHRGLQDGQYSAGYGGVGLVFAAGMDGVKQESAYLTTDGYAWGEGDLRGCAITSFGYSTGEITPGTGNAYAINFRDDTEIPNNTFFAAGDGILVHRRRILIKSTNGR